MSESKHHREDAALDVGDALEALRFTNSEFADNLDGGTDLMRQYHGTLKCIEHMLERAARLLEQAEIAEMRERKTGTA